MENGVIKIGGDYSKFSAATKAAMTKAQQDSKAFVDAAEKQMKRLDGAAAGAGGGARKFGGGSSGSWQLGQLSQQMQDVAIQAQMGTRATVILAQQGSQIASVFGAKGAIIGGGIAMAAVFADASGKVTRMREEFGVFNAELGSMRGKGISELAQDMSKISAEMEKTEVSMKGSASYGNAFMSQPVGFFTGDTAEDQIIEKQKQINELRALGIERAKKTAEISEKEANIATIRADGDELLADKLQRELELNTQIEKTMSNQFLVGRKAKQDAIDNVRKISDEKQRGESRKRDEDAAAYAAQAGNEAEVIKRKGSGDDMTIRSADKLKNEFELERQILDIKRSKDTEENKALKTAALRLKYQAMQNQLEKSDAEFMAVKNKEAREIYINDATFGKVQTENQKRLLKLEKERAALLDLRDNKTISDAEYKKQMHVLDMNETASMIQQGIGPEAAVNARGRMERKQKEAQDKAFKKSEDKMGLTGIARGMGGEIISGIDPATGERIRGQKLKDRAKMIADANKAKDDAKGAIIEQKSIKELVDAINGLLTK